MKYRSIPLRGALALFTVLILTASAGPAAAGHDRGGMTLFQDVHFEGHYETLHGDVRNLRGSHLGNDCASSVAVPHGCSVTLYRDADFRGPAITLHHDLADLRYTPIGNDRVSSLSVDCYGCDRYGRDHRYRDGPYRGDYRPHGITVFSDAGFRGRQESFHYDDLDLRDNPIRQDTISSVAVAPGCRAVLYSDVSFRGRATAVTGGEHDLRYSTFGNDRVSSIRVDCRRYR